MRTLLQAIGVSLAVVATGTILVKASAPDPPPNPAMIAFAAGRVEEGRKIAAATLSTSINSVPDQKPINALDADAASYGEALCRALQAVGSWTQVEAVHLYRQGGSAEDFVANAWGPLFNATKDLVGRLDITIGQCQKLLDASGTKDPLWTRRLGDWRNARHVALLTVSLLAKKAQRPDFVKQVFTLGGKIGTYADAQAFLTQEQDPSHVFAVDLAAPVLSPAEEKEVREVLSRWMIAVEKNDTQAFTALYDDPGQAQRLLETGLFQSFKYQQVDTTAGHCSATKLSDGSLFISLGCPAQNRRGDKDYFRGEFTLVHVGNDWKFRNPDDDGVSLAEKQEIRTLVATWFEAASTQDLDKLVQLYNDPDSARKLLAPELASIANERMDLADAVFSFHRQADGSITLKVEKIATTNKEGRHLDDDQCFKIATVDHQPKLCLEKEKTP
jgi:hypothetical protein